MSFISFEAKSVGLTDGADDDSLNKDGVGRVTVVRETG
jgi:hypothetical protein